MVFGNIKEPDSGFGMYLCSGLIRLVIECLLLLVCIASLVFLSAIMLEYTGIA